MKMTISQNDRTWAEEARSRFPQITSYGYGLPERCMDGWESPMSDKDIEQIIAARDFLSQFKPVKKVSYGSMNSYASPTATKLKSLLQEYRGVYVYEGDIVLAASELGIPTRNHCVTHAQIGISRQQYKALREVVESSRKQPTQ
jgi:hypothetical protein